MPLGHLNINLSGLTTEQAAQLQTFLSEVLAFQLNIKISTQSLSEMRFTPRKNYDTNQMEPGLFQMLDGTNVICDETGIQPGKIENNGV